MNTDLSLRLLCLPEQLLAGVLQDEIREYLICVQSLLEDGDAGVEAFEGTAVMA